MRRWAHLGVAGWIAVGRRVAPWGLLVFALFQLKTLSDKVKQVEESEFSAVQNQVETLRGDLTKMHESVMNTERELTETQKTLKSVNLTLEQAKKHAPELAKAIDDARDVSVAVKSGLPAAADAEQLAQSVQSAGGQMTQVLTNLPSVKTTGELSTDVDAAKQSLARLPGLEQAQALAAELADDQRRLDAIGAALPKPEQAVSLEKALEADEAVLVELKNKAPSAEQLQALQKDLARAHDVLANIAPATKGAAN